MFEKCEFCENWDFENVNFVKNEPLEMRIFAPVCNWNNIVFQLGSAILQLKPCKVKFLSNGL